MIPQYFSNIDREDLILLGREFQSLLRMTYTGLLATVQYLIFFICTIYM